MSREKEESSHSGKPPKKKKKYLYLERFENHQEKTNSRFKTVDDRINRLAFWVIILAAGLAGLGALVVVLL